MLGTGLASASSGVLNNYIDREIDKLMSRTSNRALPTGRVDPQIAFAFGLLLGFTGFVILFYAVNPFNSRIGSRNNIFLCGDLYCLVKA